MSLKDLLFLKAGGGGNPNRVETRTGTLAEPFGVLANSISQGLYNGDCSAVMDIDSRAIGGGEFSLVLKSNSDGIEGVLANVTNTECYAAQVIWAQGLDYSVSSAHFCTASTSDETLTITDISEYASLITTTLTIYWHPMPTTP